MFDRLTEAVVTIATAIVGVAMLAILVSRKSQTPAVIQAAASGFGNSLAVAEAPVTGANTPINLSYPSSSGLELPAIGVPIIGSG
jgi:anti-sigma-K factor RskA